MAGDWFQPCTVHLLLLLREQCVPWSDNIVFSEILFFQRVVVGGGSLRRGKREKRGARGRERAGGNESLVFAPAYF